MVATFISSAVGVIAGNYIYQIMCAHPDWAVAHERSAFQAVALILVAAAIGIRRINA